MQVQAPQGIVNEPQRMPIISYADNTKKNTHHAGIELRGSSWRFFDKKPITLISIKTLKD